MKTNHADVQKIVTEMAVNVFYLKKETHALLVKVKILNKLSNCLQYYYSRSLMREKSQSQKKMT